MIAVRSGTARGHRDSAGDAELIAACLDGDRSSWDTLVERYQRLVYSVPRRCGLSEADAEDVFQNVFLLLFRKLDTLRDGDRLAAWLLTTAHRESWRASRRNGPVVDPDFSPVLDEETLADDEEQQMVREALRALGGRCQRLLTLLFNSPGQPNYQAIADEMEMPIGSIGPTRARCFRKLERILVQMGYQPSAPQPENATASTDQPG